MFDTLLGVCIGLVIGAFAGDAFGAKVRGFVMDIWSKTKGTSK
jgi:hypothetical protein